MAKIEEEKKRAVMVTTERRGVFVGYLESYDQTVRRAVITEARMVIYFGTTRGVMELVETGPTGKTKASAKAPRIELEVCTAVFDMTAAAEEAWKRVS